MDAAKARSGQRVCVVGAGPCGLTALKNLSAAGIRDLVCYDEGQAIGGNWVFDERPDRHSVYDVTHLISSKRLSEFEDYPFPDAYPDYPSHRQIRSYFEDYAAHFGLLQFVRLATRVLRATLLPDQRWVISSIGPQGTREETFDYLVVCTGHHREPFTPEYPGRFSGEALHSSEYKRPDIFKDKRVLVVGGGNSACDISVDLARVARKTCISMRRGYHILPKLMFGRPSDLLYARLRNGFPLPRWLLQLLGSAAIRLFVGPLEKYGLQKPKGKLFETHPTLSSDILNALRNGTVLSRVGIDRLEENRVRFSDGTSEEFDVIIWATGYRISFPFLDKSVVTWEEAESVPLYLKMMHGLVPSVFFIGLFQPIGCIWRLADHQARIAALQIKGLLERPDDIEARIEREVNSPHWRFDKVSRHAVEVDYHDFRHELLKEIGSASLSSAGPQPAGPSADAAA
jgi:cation diffusion facilitator CzcD-associated flavoprotein CzcO